MKLTAQSARDLQPGGVLKDHVVKGLELHCYPNGRKSWLLYYRAPNGERRRPKLAEYPAHRVDEARDLAADWQKQIARGNDPGAERAAYRASLTVSEACDEYLRRWAKVRDKPRTVEEKERNIKLHIKPQLGGLKVVDVKLADIDNRLTAVEAGSGKTAARNVRALLSSLFHFAEHDDNKWRPRYSNPVRDAVRFKQPKRRRHMTGAEAPAVARELDNLAAEYPARVAALWVILLAGTRVTELITARRSQLAGNTVVLTEHKTDRTGEARVITLPAQALARIAALPDDGSGFLFGQGLKRSHIFTIWEKARAAAGCPDLRVQDFRRTFASAAKSAGRSLDVVGELFGHRNVETTRDYSWLFDEAAAAAAQDTADELEKRMRG